MYRKINKDRGYGDTVYEVVSIARKGAPGEEYTLRDIKGNKVNIYSAHTYLPTVWEIRQFKAAEKK
jgi:hypothetical protein